MGFNTYSEDGMFNSQTGGFDYGVTGTFNFTGAWKNNISAQITQVSSFKAFLHDIDYIREHDIVGLQNQWAGKAAIELTYGTAENVKVLFTGRKFTGESLQGYHRTNAALDGGVSLITLGVESTIVKTLKSTPLLYNEFAQSKAGFHAGGFVNFRLTEKFFIRPEVLFSQQGSEFEINPDDTNVYDPEDPIFVSDGISGKIRESVILVPVMAGIFVTENLDIELGPQLAWVVNRDVTYKNNPYPLALIRNDNSGDFEFGVNAGLGYNFGARYRIGLRYNYGITERQNLHSSVFQLGLHYTL